MRKSGILMHITSLPGPYGIGTMGKNAFEFVDFLERSGQSCWQILPLTPTGYGDSPYQSCSAYAGNHYLIDLDLLIQEGLLTPEDLDGIVWSGSESRVDFGLQYRHKLNVLRKAYTRFHRGPEYEAFIASSAGWLPDFSLFMALKDASSGDAWYAWDRDLKYRDPAALTQARVRLSEEISFYHFVQYLFHRQWSALRDYAHSKHITIIGDVPIYVPLDSVEVWCNPELFQLDETLTPTAVAGCPPDAFSEDGQLWGNPLYRWDRMEADGFRWWLRRMGAAGERYDTIRLDHFRGFQAYWSVPYGDKTSRNGHWITGPGMAFINALKAGLPELDFIAEDLGYLTPEVLKLRDDSGYPGMRVLGFAFDTRGDSDYLPHNHIPNSVCYTGTHDNMTLQQWFDSAGADTVSYAREYMGLNREEGYVWGAIRSAMSSVSELCVVQMQDYLELGETARMNFPGTMTSANWTWRAEAGFAGNALSDKIRAMSVLFGRAEPKTLVSAATPL